MARTELELSMLSIKVILGTITAMFIISASVLAAVGISIFVTYHDISFLFQALSDSNYVSPSVIITIIGIITITIALFGFIGCLRESVLLVNVFAFLTSLVFIFMIATVIAVFTVDKSVLMRYLEIPVQYYTTDLETQSEIDYLQSSLLCCGNESYDDYANVTFTSDQSTITYDNITLPFTCCTEFSNTGECYAVAKNGCKKILATIVTQNSGILGVLGVSIAFVQLMGIIFAILLGKTIRRVKSERALRKWKIQEQIINARTAELFKSTSTGNIVYLENQTSTNA